MTYDWKSLERKDRDASNHLTLGLGIGWAAMGAVGLVLVLATGESRRLGSFIFWLALGLIYLAISAGLRRRRLNEAQRDARQTDHPPAP